MGNFTSKGLQLEKSDLKNLWGELPQGLVPIGDAGIYISPHVKEDEPVSPFDCENYPDSPFCGGQPFTRTPAGIDLEFSANKCGISVTGTPILGFTKLPPISVAWLAPECRNDYPEQKKPEISGLPKAGDFPELFWPEVDENSTIFLILSYNRDAWAVRPQPDEPALQILSSWWTLKKITRENRVAYNNWIGRNDFLEFTVEVEFHQRTIRQYYKEDPTKGYNQDTKETSLFVGQIWSESNYFKFTGIQAWQSDRGYIYFGKYKDLKNLKAQDGLSYWRTIVSSSSNNPAPGYANLQANFFSLLHFQEIPLKGNRPNPDDYKKRKCCEMACCDSGQAQQRQRDQDNSEILALLREINKKLGNFPVKVNLFDANENEVGAQSKVESISTVAQGFFRAIAEIEKALKCIGIDQLPIFTPSSIIDDESNGILGDLGDLKNQIFKQKIESLAELALWDIKNKYEIFGKWQEVITIEDSDPTKKGNQPKKIVLPNMARTFRELMLLNSIQVKTLGMLFDISLKMYIDLANTKISAAVSEAILRDIQDYLDYPTEIKKLDVPLGISIPSDNTPNDDREDLERFLRNSTAKAKFDDWTGEGSMTEMLITLLRAAESIIGQNYERLQ